MSLDGLDSDLSAVRLRRIEAVTEAALAHLEVQDLLVELLDRVRELLTVDTAAVLLLDPSGSHLVATAARGIEEEVRQGVRVPLGKGFAGRIAADKRPVTIEKVDHANVLNPILREKGIRSLLGVPLLVAGDVIGVLHIGTLHSRRFTTEDSQFLQLVADRIALATQSRISLTERAAATILQRSLLPERLPDVDGLELGARYVAGEGQVGGDWYDVFLLPSGWLCVVVGDVVGRGLRAAISMGRLRTAIRGHALECGEPATLLGMLDRQVRHFEHDVMATVLCAMIEPSREWVSLSCAGHPPPVLALPHQAGEVIKMPPDLPLGIDATRPRRTTRVELPPGATLCLYTDGLIERRGRSLDHGLECLCRAVKPDSADSVCAGVMSELVGAQPPRDDIALLIIRRM